MIDISNNRSKSNKLYNSKKGFTYLLVSSLLVVVLLSIFFASRNYSYEDRTDLYSVRVKSMNNFVENFNVDVHRATHVSAFRALIALEDHVTSTGEYLTDINASFKEAFYNGTFNGTKIVIMENSSFSDYISKVKELANSLGILMDANVTRIELSQSNPWYIDVHVFLKINITDAQNDVTWYTDKDFFTTIPIENLRDPIYGKYTFNKLPNTIRQYNSSVLVNGTNISHLIEFVNNSYYVESANAPSFLMRFEGINTPSENGIESIVYVPAISSQDLDVYISRIKVDYIYFTNSYSGIYCNVTTMPADMNFIIPENRLDLYQVRDLVNVSRDCHVYT